MHIIKVWLIAFLGFISSVFSPRTPVHRSILLVLCTILSFSTVIYIPNLLVQSESVVATAPPGNEKLLNLTSKEGCQVIEHFQKIDGKAIPAYFQYIAKDKVSCGESFTVRLSPDGRTTTVVMQSKGSVILDQISPKLIRVTYINEQKRKIIQNLVVSNEVLRTINSPRKSKDWSDKCKEFFDNYCRDTDKVFALIDTAYISSLLFPSLFTLISIDLLIPFFVAAGTFELISKTLCFAFHGDSPTIPFEKVRFKQIFGKFGESLGEYGESFGRTMDFDQRLSSAKDFWNEIFTGNESESSFGSFLNWGRDQLGIPAPCMKKELPVVPPENQQKKDYKQGRSHNDPHLATFDGFRYDLQTVGEFILTKSNDGAFEVQTRQAPYASSLSINSAIATKVGSDRVALYAREFPDADTSTPLRVNGKPTTIQGDKLVLPGGGEILKQGSTYVISSSRGEKVLVSPSGAGNTAFFNISPFVYNRSGTYSGLLGNVNGNPNDDLQIRGGNNILEVRSTYGDVKKVLNLVGLRAPGALDRGEQVYFDQLYKQFANSWRVKQEESLFDYPAGKNTKSYVNPGFPDKYLTLNMLSADQIQKARNSCTEAKVTQDLMEGCIFDVGFSGFSEFARTAAEVNGYIGIVNQLFPSLNIPTPEQAVDRVIERVKPRRCLGPFCL